MPVYRLIRFEVRPAARVDAERALHDHASYVRASLPKTIWTTYRTAPTRFVTYARSDDPDDGAKATHALHEVLAPFVVGAIEDTECELVTSSDLQRRHRR
jgi:hypothetical protein